MLICVDNGFDSTKVKTKDMLFKFKSQFQEAEGNEKEILEYKNKQYINHGVDDIENDKTKGLIHKLCTIKAIAETNTKNIELLLDLPISHYRNVAFREDFIRYMEKPRYFTYKYRGEVKEAFIKSCRVAPQGLIAVYNNSPESIKGKVTGWLDFGGLTINGGVLDQNLKPLKDTLFTENLGSIILENQIKTALNQQLILNIQDYEIPLIIRNGVPGKEKESLKIIERQIKEHFKKLLRVMRTKNWSIETLEIYGVGGGVLQYTDIMKNYIPNFRLSHNPEYDTVLGLWNMGMAI